MPERVFVAGGNGENGHGGVPATGGLLGQLIALLVAEKSGFQTADNPDVAELKVLADRLSRQAMQNMEREPGGMVTATLAQ